MIVITEFMDDAAVGDLTCQFQVRYDPDLHGRRNDLLRAAGSAEAIIVRNRTKVDKQLLEFGGNLKCVGRLGTGLDNIDVGECRIRGVEVFSGAGINARSVAEYVIASAFALVRGSFGFKERILDGEWPRTEATGSELAGKRLGLVGFGATARATADIATGLGMKTAANDPYLPGDHEHWRRRTERMELTDLLGWCDIASVHVPLVDSTRHLINADALAKMRPGAFLVNASRGGVADDLAVARALESEHLGGAALDVFETEPLSDEIAGAFKNCPNLILTPHIAGVTQQANRRVSFAVGKAVANHLKE
ncbi:MAG: hydroxyacid dehydrogenase [Albidovulum sp.]|nr:hydroxyacid dehydrogenase [Albidovulum sp.]